jgi:four helix bundle protein
MFISKMVDADADTTETVVWLHFACDSGYMPEESRRELVSAYEEVGRMLGAMIAHPEKFAHS